MVRNGREIIVLAALSDPEDEEERMRVCGPEPEHSWFVLAVQTVWSQTSDPKKQIGTVKAKPEAKPTSEAGSPSAVKSPRQGELKK